MPPKAWFGIVKVIGAVRGCWWGRLDLPLLVRKRAGIPSADLQRRLMAHTTDQTTVCHWEGVSFSFTVTSRTNVLVNTRPPSLRSCKMQEAFLTRQGFLSFPGDLFQGTCTGSHFGPPMRPEAAFFLPDTLLSGVSPISAKELCPQMRVRGVRGGWLQATPGGRSGDVGVSQNQSQVG